MEILDKLSKKKHELDALKPLSNEVIHEFGDDLKLLFIYNSNALEGNSLTFTETKSVLEGYTIEGKNLNEHLDVMNHEEAFNFVFKLAQEDVEFDEICMKKIHEILSHKNNLENSGKYRNITSNEINNFFTWYNINKNHYHPVEFSARACCEFLKIHPFINNNGKLSRLIMNFEIIKNGYPLTIIDVENKEIYQNTLNKAINSNDYTEFINLIGKYVLSSFDKYFNLIANRKFTDKNYEHEFVL